MPFSNDIRAMEAAGEPQSFTSPDRESRCSSRPGAVPLSARSLQESCTSSSHSLGYLMRGSRPASTTSSSIRNWAQERAGRGPPPIPESFKCGICGGVLMDPVSLCDGTAYDRPCIEDWVGRGHRVSPVTRKELETLETRPNLALQAAVEDYFRLRETAEREQKQWVEFVGEMQSRMFRKLDQKNQEVKVLKSALLNSRRSQSFPEQLDQACNGMGMRRNRRNSNSHGDLSLAVHPPTSNLEPSAQQPPPASSGASTASGGSGSSSKSNGASNSPEGLPSPPAEENEDKSLQRGQPAFGSGPAPRSNPVKTADGHKPISLLGRLKMGARKGKDGKA